MELLFIAVLLGIVLAMVAVFAIWLVLGDWTVMWRAILAVMGASGAALIFCATSGEFEAEWLGLMWVVIVTIMAMFVLVRWRGFNLVNTTIDSPARPDEMQFSLMQIIVLTTMVGAIAAAARLLAPLVATMHTLLFGVAIAICLGTLALVATWATLRLDTTRIKHLTLAIVAIAMAGLVYVGMEMTNADPGLVWGSATIVYTIALTGSLLLARSHGFQLLRASECSTQQFARRQNH